MSLKKKKIRSKHKTTFFDQQMRSINKIRRKKNQMTAENINLILDRHFLTLELIKFNLFGEDFENYGNIVINGQTYYPYKLNLDYLAKQESDNMKLDLNIDVDILNSLKKADDINELNLKNFSKRKSITTTKYSKLTKNKSMEDIRFNKNKKELDTNNKLKLPNIFNCNYTNKLQHHGKLNLADNYMKLILLKNMRQPIDSLNSKEFMMRKTSYLKRHGGANKLNKKLNALENKYKTIDNEIKNDILINKEKTPQFQYRYKYVESKFKV
jgi:hypothetical protein